jgi:hypothetical protein
MATTKTAAVAYLRTLNAQNIGEDKDSTGIRRARGARASP